MNIRGYKRNSSRKVRSTAFEVIEVVKEFVTYLPRRDPVMTRRRGHVGNGAAHGILVGMPNGHV